WILIRILRGGEPAAVAVGTAPAGAAAATGAAPREAAAPVVGAVGGAAAGGATAGRQRLWLLFGAVAGLGLLTKHSMAFFGVAVVAALLLTRERRAFRSRWFWLGGAIAVALFLPNLLWMAQHHFPHFEMLANIKRNGRDVQLAPLAFLAQQVLVFNPLALPLW